MNIFFKVLKNQIRPFCILADSFQNFLETCCWCKIKVNVVLDSLKLFIKSENPFISSLPGPERRNFDPKNAYRKPLWYLKSSGSWLCCVHGKVIKQSGKSRWKSTQQRIKVGTEIICSFRLEQKLYAVFGKMFQISCFFQEASRTFIFVFLFKKAAKKIKTTCACTCSESIKLMLEAFKTNIHLMAHSLSGLGWGLLRLSIRL